MSAETAAKLQMQIRENSTELNDFLKDLSRWEENIKCEDKNLKTERRIEEKLPPVRSTKKKKSYETKQVKHEKNNNAQSKSKQSRINSYDYNAWSKFDVEAACKDSSEESVDEESEDEEEDEEEMQRIRETQQMHQANLEKEKGNQLFKDGKYEAAINRYTNAISLHPNNPILYANRGMALLKTDKYGAAEQDCSTALDYDPTYTKALARRATAREKLKRYKLSLEDYEKVLEFEPKNKQAILEMEKIKKIMAKQETSLAMDKDKPTGLADNPSMTQPQEEITSDRKRRSNKPLKRIPIAEVGIEEETEQKPNRNNRISACNRQETVPLVPSATTTLTVPTSSFMFETQFKRVKNDQEKLYKYLQLIPLKDYTKLFHQCIDSLIAPFLSTLLHCYKRDDHFYHDELDALTYVKRFEMAALFLSASDKQILHQLLDHMMTNPYSESCSKEKVVDIAKKYNITV